MEVHRMRAERCPASVVRHDRQHAGAALAQSCGLRVQSCLNPIPCWAVAAKTDHQNFIIAPRQIGIGGRGEAAVEIAPAANHDR